jgi:tetratricopeptide (TPR) repeat protein
MGALAALLVLTTFWLLKGRGAIAGSTTLSHINHQAWLLLDSRDVTKFEAVELLFDDALRIDPHSVDAHAGKAILYVLMGKEEAAESEAAQAVAAAPGTSYLKIVRGFDRMMYHWDWAEAGRLMTVNPGCFRPICLQWRALYLGLTGETLLGVRDATTALELSDNTSLAARTELGQLLYWTGQYDAAIRELKTVLAAGGVATQAREYLWQALLMKGDRQAAAETLMLALEPTWYRLNPGDEFAELQNHPERMGTPEFWKRLLEIEARTRNQPYRMAAIAMAAGDRNRALTELENGVKSRHFFLPFARRDPLFEPLRNEPRYQAVMKAVGL